MTTLTTTEYEARVEALAAVARLHYFGLTGQPHPWPVQECLDCAEIDRRRRELLTAGGASWPGSVRSDRGCVHEPGLTSSQAS